MVPRHGTRAARGGANRSRGRLPSRAVTFVVAWLVYPVVVAAVSLGCGALLERASGLRLPGALLVPAGFAVIVCATLLTTSLDATAELSAPLVLALAVAGLAWGRPWRGRRFDWWAAAAAVGAFLVFGAPVLLSGAPTFAGYIKLDDTATWFNFIDHVMVHGRSLAGLEISTYEANLEFFIEQRGYPMGSLTPLGATAQMVFTDVAWVFQPYMSALGAMIALTLYALIAPIVRSAPLRALAAFVGAQPALVFAYAQWGGIKEVVAAVSLATLAAVAAPVLSRTSGLRAGIPFAVAAAALLGVLGPAGAPWILAAAVLAVVGAALARRGSGARDLAAQVGIAAAVGAVAAIPSLVLVGKALNSPDLYTSGLEAGSEGLGNLIKPLSVLQVLGPWPTADFRLDPDSWPIAIVLIVLTAAAAAVGIALAWRRQAWALLTYLVTAAIGGIVIIAFAKPWVDAKAFTIIAPAALGVAMAGAVGLIDRAGREPGIGTIARPVGAALAVLVAVGVLWSNVLAYGKVNLAPYDRLAELEEVGERIDGRGPTLLSEPEFYGARHFLRRGDPEGAADFRRRPVALLDGAVLLKDAWADMDGFDPSQLSPYRTIVVRRSPAASRPGADFRRTFRGDWYEIWERDPKRRVIRHLPLGVDATTARCGPIRLNDGTEQRPEPCPTRPVAAPVCRQIEMLAAEARSSGARLVAARRPAPIVVDPLSGRFPSTWIRGAGEVRATTPGTLVTSVAVPRAGRYEVWLGGSFGRGFEVWIAGRRVGRVKNSLSNRGQFTRVGDITLARGNHPVEIRFGNASLAPGSAETRQPLGPLVLTPPGDATLETVAPARARTLCRERLDWVEIVS
jgi:hypothetical protein